ncbi:hypothetical protein HR12_26265 [Microbacterium sp. SUBG005]|nr:hypothetical protein HR12_26265 [Microbacterium sp. SUBG005]
MATGLQIASTIVQVVHDLVRDILSQLVGSAISWATQAVVTVGLATPWIVAQVSSRVASWTAKISSKLTGLLRSCGKLGDLLTELKALLDRGAGMLRSVPRRRPDRRRGPTRTAVRSLRTRTRRPQMTRLRHDVPATTNRALAAMTTPAPPHPSMTPRPKRSRQTSRRFGTTRDRIMWRSIRPCAGRSR